MSTLPRQLVVFFLIILVLSMLNVSTVKAAQVNENTSGKTPPIKRPPRIELDEPKPQPSAQESIEKVFEKAVDALASVLFYRVGADERNYVIIQHEEYYVRDRDSDAPFKKHDPRGVFEAETIDQTKLTALAARGKIVTGVGDRNYRLGKIYDRPVEYVTVIVEPEGLAYGAKYVLDESDEKFHRVLKKRNLLSEEDTLSPSKVRKLARMGRLKANPDKTSEKTENPLAPYLFTEPIGGAPVVVLWLVCGALFFTIYMKGYNVWGSAHAFQVVRGKYDNPEEAGEVTHFQALASALSATVGLGNIAGVTIAMTMGGPGAFLWMILCGFFGMASKFTECTLGQKYRLVKPDGTVLGGPMQYLKAGLAEMKLAPLGVLLSLAFSVMCILASFGGGNMFQANQSGTAVLATLQEAELQKLAQLEKQVTQAAADNDIDRLKTLQKKRTDLEEEIKGFEKVFRPIFGTVMAIFVAVVIIGGIRRIGAAAEKLVPSMCMVYIAACIWIILTHITLVPELVLTIFTDAFTGEAMAGGIIGVLVIGVQRGAFSNEAGVGSAAIAHSAAKTEEPIREGSVAMLGPFIDTVVVCSMTALVILITGAWDRTDWIVGEGLEGAALTSRAFANEISWFPWVLSMAVVLFAYSTIISWSYYGERCWELLFGARSTVIYKALAVFCVFVGAVVNLGAVLTFSDMMILSMAFPNILGAVLLSPKVKRELFNYWRRYKAGEFKAFK